MQAIRGILNAMTCQLIHIFAKETRKGIKVFCFFCSGDFAYFPRIYSFQGHEQSVTAGDQPNVDAGVMNTGAHSCCLCLLTPGES